MKNKPVAPSVNSVNHQRRGFLRTAGIAPVAGVAALLGASSTPGAAAPAKAAEKPGPNGYHETEHIRKYYQSARF